MQNPGSPTPCMEHQTLRSIMETVFSVAKKAKKDFISAAPLKYSGKYIRAWLRSECFVLAQATLLPLHPGVKLSSANGQENRGVEAVGEKQIRATQNNMEESG